MESVKTATYGNPIPIFSSISRRTILDVGGGDGKVAFLKYPDSNICLIDKLYGWEVEENGLPEGSWDVILVNHLIEHLVNPDQFLESCRKVMNQKTLLEIGTPNLTAWFNRILFLFGFVPHSMELSTRINVGKPFDWGKEPLGGHLRIFTIPALLDLLKFHGFKILTVTGECSTYPCHPFIRIIDRIMTWISPHFASAFRVRCTLG